MKTSYGWLQDFVDLNVTPGEFAGAMTLSGSKVEEIIVESEAMQGIVTGRIKSLAPHPDADKLLVLQVDTDRALLNIVSGAPNLAVGQIVPVAAAGSTLPDGQVIEAALFRGVRSEGMLCSVTELGFTRADFPDAPENGVYVFPEGTGIGLDAGDVLGIREVIIDFEITPNRPDCLSVEGLAREAAVTFDLPFRPRHSDVKGESHVNTKGTVEVTIEDPDLCRRFVARVASDIRIEPSPRWLRQRLRAAGVRPINNIVDITNYVMLELGQPLHAYDLRDLRGQKISARRAVEGEMLTTLDEVPRRLSKDMLVIADGAGAIGIAGVMGGFNSEIKADTKTVVLEAASFLAPSVRRTSTALGLRTEASSRFEKGLPAENCDRAINLAAALIEQLGAGRVSPDLIDIYPAPEPARTIAVDPAAITAVLGEAIEARFITDTLSKLGFTETELPGIWTIPPFRADIVKTVDLAEEAARFYGYNKIKPVLSIGRNMTVGGLSVKQRFNQKIIDRMIAAGGYETITYPFENLALRQKLGLTNDGLMALKNPLNEDFTHMRTTLAGSMLQVAGYNRARGNTAGRLFERGRTYHKSADGLPYEVERLGVLLFSETAGGTAECFFLLKGALESMLDALGIPDREYKASADTPYLHPGMQALIEPDLGVLGVLHPETAGAFDLTEYTVYAELNVDRLLDLAQSIETVQPLPRYPSVTRDIALVADKSIPAVQIERWLKEAAGPLLASVELFDVYEGEKIGSKNRSLAYHLIFRDPERTLNEAVLEPAAARIEAMLNVKGLTRR